jgi:hypothetical protein
MRPIFIDNHIIDLSSEYSNNLFNARDSTFIKPMDGLKYLEKKLRRRSTISSDYSNYIKTIIRLYKFINNVQPNYYDIFHNRFFARYSIDLGLKITIDKKKLPFHKHISRVMRYDAVREKEFLPYAKKLGIRTCIYCNTQYALSINVSNSQYGKFELDHFKPQSKFPYLCTNFYNLTPSCSNCNKYKSGRNALFSLYTDNHANLNPFSFRLDKRSIIKYMITQDFNTLEIVFDHGTDPSHNTIFKIQATYNVLKDVIEEIIWKHKIYNQHYLSSLKNAFELKFHAVNFQRFILGNYIDQKDIHKRPLSKITQDIAKQLKILR